MVHYTTCSNQINTIEILRMTNLRVLYNKKLQDPEFKNTTAESYLWFIVLCLGVLPPGVP